MAEIIHSRSFSLPIQKPVMILLFAVAVLGQVACGTIDVESRWRDFPVAVDGKSDDWGDALVYFKDADVALGVANDDHNLFLCLQAGSERGQVPFMAQGLVLWVDAKGGKRRDFGIRFPLGIDLRSAGEIPGNAEDQAQAQTRRREALAQSRDELEILGPGDVEPQRIRIADIKGFEIAARTTAGRFVYEIRIPLAAGEEAMIAIGSQPGKTIGLGLEIPESGSSYRRPGGMGGRGGRGGMGGGMRGGMGGRMGGRTGGRGGTGLQNFKIWADVKLAAAAGRVSAARPSLSSRPQPD